MQEEPADLAERASNGDTHALIHLFLGACRGEDDAIAHLVDVAQGEGSGDARDRLVEWARGYLRGFAEQLGLAPGDDPSELAQSCAGRLIAHLDDVHARDARSFIAYLRQMARNWQRDRARRRGTRREVAFEDDSSGLPGSRTPSRERGPDELADDDVEALLSRVEEPDRTLLYKKFVEGLRYAEIAAGLGPSWTPDRVRMRIARALRRLRGAGAR